MSKEEILLNVFIAFFSGILGAIASTVIAPIWKDYYNKRKEIKHIKQSLKRYISYMDCSFKVPFMYHSSSTKNAEKQFSLSVMLSDFEYSLSGRRFDKSIMLSDDDYKDILEFCYKQNISHFDLDSQEKIYTELFLKKEYDFI